MRKQDGVVCEAPDGAKIKIWFSDNIKKKEWFSEYCANTHDTFAYKRCPYYRMCQQYYDKLLEV